MRTIIVAVVLSACAPSYELSVREVRYEPTALDEAAPHFEIWIASEGELTIVNAIDDAHDGSLSVAHEPVTVGEDVQLWAWMLPRGLGRCQDESGELVEYPETGLVACRLRASCPASIRGPGELPCVDFDGVVE